MLSRCDRAGFEYAIGDADRNWSARYFYGSINAHRHGHVRRDLCPPERLCHARHTAITNAAAG